MPYLFRYNQLNEAMQSLYNTLYRALFLREEFIYCAGCSPAEINAVMRDILRDHPELCHFEGKWEYSEGMVRPRYVLPQEAIFETQEAAKAAYSALNGDCLPRQAYRWLLEQVAYDPTAPHSQNAYGALVQGKAVCKGIAKAYQLLMESEQIPCILAEGTLDGVTKHVWNMIYFEEQWYHVDVTMGYPCFWHLTEATDAWGGLLRRTEELARSHRIDQIGGEY